MTASFVCKEILRILFLVSCLYTLSSCTTLKGNHEEIVRMERKVSEYQSVDVQVTSSLIEAEEILPQLKKKIMAAINRDLAGAGNKNGKRVPANAENSLRLKVRVVDYNKVTWFARFAWGAIAGDDRIGIQADLVDASSEKIIGSFTANSTYRGDVFKNGPENIIKGITKEIQSYLRARM